MAISKLPQTTAETGERSCDLELLSWRSCKVAHALLVRADHVFISKHSSFPTQSLFSSLVYVLRVGKEKLLIKEYVL